MPSRSAYSRSHDRPPVRRALIINAAFMMAVLAVAGVASAQATAKPNLVVPETADVARGWSLLASGDLAGASNAASDLAAKYPRSGAALALGVEIAIARSGGLGGLQTYERWLGNRTVEEPYVLRRVAGAVLREIASGDPDRANRLAAIEALLADGEGDAARLLPTADAAAAETAVRGAAGSAKAVDTLIAQLTLPPPAKRLAVAALGRSGNPRAIGPVTRALSDPDATVRAAAAEALGALGATAAIPQLRLLLQDPVFNVHLTAAAALLQLKDTSGLEWLRQLQTSEHAGIRLAAARAAKSDPTAEWLSVVRALASDPDPDIRRQAAELLAPHDPDLAKSTLEPLLTDPNPAERQAAGDTYVRVTADFALLRRFLRDTDPGTRVRAADRMLELTR